MRWIVTYIHVEVCSIDIDPVNGLLEDDMLNPVAGGIAGKQAELSSRECLLDQSAGNVVGSTKSSWSKTLLFNHDVGDILGACSSQFAIEGE